ncbi:hypothetical protein [Hoeflea poritis]|uniref:Uncharacterized protein n=1 Tax=Hoeflea poritis TaxID=2993659 RepID=A0ABT4VUL6_9HYPH|nr:hypothetical protein [Hoeflea poritis]MDA4847890.1 hypothetical protein [Hoeflea poritis]
MNDDRFKLIDLNPMISPDPAVLRRQARRPMNFRDADFDEKFDDTTIFYDVFEERPGSLCLIGPPLWNLSETVLKGRFSVGGEAVSAAPEARALDRCCAVELAAGPNGHPILEIETDTAALQSTIGKSHNDTFRGSRAMVTMSRDNELSWIDEWVRYHVRMQRADSFLFFDNQSTKYDAREIVDLARRIDGIRNFWVVDWPFKFGPSFGQLRFRGLFRPGILTLPFDLWRHGRKYQLWDSNFSKYAALELARRRFLRNASSVLNADIDELVLPASSGQTVFEAAEQSANGYLQYAGTWISSAIDGYTPGQGFRHRDFKYKKPQAGPSALKWCAVPQKIPPQSQWKIHCVTGMQPGTDAGIDYLHFTGINTNWKYERSVFATPPDAGYEVDDRLSGLFAA